MTITVKQEKNEEKEAEDVILFSKKSKRSSKIKIKLEVDKSILGTRDDNNNNIALKQKDDDSDLNSQTCTVNRMDENKKEANYYESSYTQTSAINYLMDHLEENRPHGCRVCPKRYKTATELKIHFRAHTGERPYNCAYCPKAFYRTDARAVHEQRHRGDRQYECQKCDAKFTTNKDLIQHGYYRHPVSTPYVCDRPNCDKKYVVKSVLMNHIKWTHQVKNHQCLTCSVAFTCTSHLHTHFKTKKHLRLSQQQQQQKQNSESIPTNDEEESIRKIFKCKTCSNVYKTKERLRRHKTRREHRSAKTSSNNNISVGDNNMHEGEKSPVENVQLSTPQVTIKKERVEEEIDSNNKNEYDNSTMGQLNPATSQKEVPSIIKQEMEESRILETRNSNNNAVQKEEEEDDYPDLNSLNRKDESAQKEANYYETSYTQSSAIEYTMNHIQENRPFGCNFCQMRYKRGDHLQRHLRRHTGERPYNCVYCGRAFYRSETRDDHERIHRGDPQYECPNCDAKFVTRVTLLEHTQRVHPVNTPYVCPVPNCKQKFARMGFLTKHVKFYHGVRDQNCLTCSVSFKQLCDLERHFKTKKHLRLSQQQQQQENCKVISQAEKDWTYNNKNIFKCGTCLKVFKSSERLERHKERRGHKRKRRKNNKVQDNPVHQPEEAGVQDENCMPISTMKSKKQIVQYELHYINEHGIFTMGQHHQVNLVEKEKENPNRSNLITSFLCGVCLMSFGTSGGLKLHLTRTQHAPHECPVCLQNFRTINILKIHLFKHQS